MFNASDIIEKYRMEKYISEIQNQDTKSIIDILLPCDI